MAVMSSLKTHVRPEDTLWVLGDLTCTSNLLLIDAALALMQGLGVADMRLVSGNHDPVWPGHRDAYRWHPKYLEVFRWITPFARMKLAGEQVLLSHFPYQYGGDHTHEDRYAQYRLPDLGGVLVHGHTHSSERISCGPGGGLQVCVCWEAWSRPVSDQEITALIAGNASLW